MDDDIQQQVKKWREERKLIPCQALPSGITRAQCMKRQNTWRHYIQAPGLPGDEGSQKVLSPIFYMCQGCPYFRPRKVKKKAMRTFGYVMAGKLPTNQEDTYNAE